LSLKRSAVCSEQDSGFSSPQSNRDGTLNPNEKGSESGESMCGSCNCLATGKVYKNEPLRLVKSYKSWHLDFNSTEKCTNPSPPVSMDGNDQHGTIGVATSNPDGGQTGFKSYQNSEQQESNSTSSNEEDMDQMR